MKKENRELIKGTKIRSYLAAALLFFMGIGLLIAFRKESFLISYAITLAIIAFNFLHMGMVLSVVLKSEEE